MITKNIKMKNIDLWKRVKIRSTKLFCVFSMLVFQSCVLGGTHGSIKAYNYPVTKYTLEKAINSVISKKSNIKMADTTQQNYVIDLTGGKRDTLFTKHNNCYVDFSLAINQVVYEYEFQYVGTKEVWDTSKVSCLSIAYAYDDKYNGGSEGNGGFPWYKPSLKKKLVTVFENEFINKVDEELGLKHTEAED